MNISTRRYAVVSNNRAFTFIEALFAFSIYIIIISLVLPVFQIVLNQEELKERLEIMEWNVFCSQAKKEIHMSQNANVIGKTLILTNGTDTIIYEKYGTLIRRRVNSLGHEVLLQNVSDVNFSLLNNAVKISVKSLRGNEYSLTVYSFIDWTN